jgi:galactokinase
MRDAAARIVARIEHPASARWFRAPGRVNLIGEHTDYNDGFVLPVAIDRDCVVACTPAHDVRATSLELRGTVAVPADGSAELRSGTPTWKRLVAALVHELAEAGRPRAGMKALVASDVPIGSGLSSSAAFEVACAVALAGMADWAPSPTALAQACRAAEERATGVPCGIMDQLVSIAASEGRALLIDCRTLETSAVPLPPNVGLLVVHSGQPRTLAASAYQERRRACEELARTLGIAALRDASPVQVADHPLGRHVVSENGRVLEAAQALEDGDLAWLGSLLNASHASLRDDFGVSTPALDALVEELVATGAAGARLTGAGFGGSVVAVCEATDLARISSVAGRRYRRRTGLEPQSFACHATEGAGPREAPQVQSRPGSRGRP